MDLEDLVSLCKRRGFIYQSCAVYGGVQGIFDYGPLGVELKNNIKKSWWRSMVYERCDVFGLDSSIILHKNVLKNSGHADTFTDPLIDCKKCKMRFREDHIKDKKCPNCGASDFSEKRDFNLMMSTNLGPIEGTIGYLRPETAQGIFLNFKNVCDSFSPSLPFGIAQIGKAFRNEITPRNFIFRAREFEQMELEFFVYPGDDESWYSYWIEERIKWWKNQGLDSKNIELFEQPKTELAHYSKATTDILFKFPHGTEELEGIANRTDFDLGSHTKAQSEFEIQAKVRKNEESVMKLASFIDDKWVIPYIIEPSAGVDRAFLAVLTSSYTKEELKDGETRIVLKLKPHLAPVKVAVMPLAKNKENLVEYAKRIVNLLKQEEIFPVVLELSSNIGKTYRKHDEIGTPFCVTVDFETLDEQKDTVTIRNRDSMQQIRLHFSELVDFFRKKLR